MKSGGFGTLLMLGHDRASPERTKNTPNKRGGIFGRAGQAIMNAIRTHVQEKDEEKR